MNHSRVRKSSMLLPSYILDQKHTHLIPFTPRHLRPLTLSSVKEKRKTILFYVTITFFNAMQIKKHRHHMFWAGSLWVANMVTYLPLSSLILPYVCFFKTLNSH